MQRAKPISVGPASAPGVAGRDESGNWMVRFSLGDFGEAGRSICGTGVGVYMPKHRELAIMSRMADSGRAWAQYSAGLLKAAVRAEMEMRDGSVETMKPSRAHVLRL